MKRRVIFTADDYGMCREVNDGIEECLAAGAVRSVCVMTNMPLCEEAKGLQKKYPGISVGLHWTVSQGAPVLPREAVGSLVDSDGQFCRPLDFKRRWRRGLIRPEELRAELTAQHERYVAVAGAPDYWNTHQNTHVTPGLFQFFAQTGLDLEIPAMRSHRRLLVTPNQSRLMYWASHPLFLVKGWVIASYCARVEHQGVKMPLGLIYSPTVDRTADILSVVTNTKLPQTGRVMEIIFHPATAVVPELFGGVTGKRVDEWRLLRDPHLRERLDQSSVECAAFTP